MAKPGKGLISTSRMELVRTAMALLHAGDPDPVLLDAARQQAVGLSREVAGLDQDIKTSAMNPDQLADLSAFLVVLDRQLEAWKGQAATLGSKGLEDAFKEAESSLRSFVQRLKAADAAFARIFNEMTGSQA